MTTPVDPAHMPFRYLHFVSPRIDTFLFVGIGLVAFALHERERLKGRAKQASQAQISNPTASAPTGISASEISSLPLHQLIVRKADRWWNKVSVPQRAEALGLELKDWKKLDN
ncbi:UNVERIFIED_CONTAM: hypothetical protein HDU68_012234 [Siphonaria sp. JEL0065]|nr:hypothetical protein HDU68_012234 [Siphonaria sp. JEL0065]